MTHVNYNYIEAISVGFPLVQCHALGLGDVYADIIWDAGNPIPDQATLDTWIANNPKADSFAVTKYEFRKLFTLTERVAFDNAGTNTNVPAQYRAILLTMAKDLEQSGIVYLDNPDVAAGVHLIEQLGLIATGRADRVLSNQPPIV